MPNTSTSSGETSEKAELAFAVDFASLAREIAQDIFPVEQVVKLNNLSDRQWARIQRHPKFIQILTEMQREWNATSTTAERIKVKAQAGIESKLEGFITDMGDASIPLAQRTEALRTLARLGELDGQKGIDLGGKFQITLNIGTTQVTAQAEPKPVAIEHVP